MTFADLIACIGEDAAHRLVLVWGGQRRWIPVRPSPELVRRIDAESAMELCKRYGGSYECLPSRNYYDARRGWARIMTLHRQGVAINDIATDVGLSRRTVFRVLAQKITEI